MRYFVISTCLVQIFSSFVQFCLVEFDKFTKQFKEMNSIVVSIEKLNYGAHKRIPENSLLN